MNMLLAKLRIHYLYQFYCISRFAKPLQGSGAGFVAAGAVLSNVFTYKCHLYISELISRGSLNICL